MTNFNKDTIVFDAKPASKVSLPSSSRQKVVFLDTDNKLKTLDYSGNLELLGGNVTFTQGPEGLYYSSQTQKYYRNENGQLLEVSGEGVEGDPTQVAEIFEVTIPEGPKGKDGINGVDGKDGLPGRDGVDGRDGKDGLPGKDGRDGVDGRDGKDGKDGVNGSDGIGIQGVPGKDGKDGRDGKDGLPGKDGKDGRDGERGPAGASGGGVTKATVIRLINEYAPSGGGGISGDYVISVNGLSGEVTLDTPDFFEVDAIAMSGSLVTIASDMSASALISANTYTNSSLSDYTLLSTSTSISGDLLNGFSSVMVYDVQGNLSTLTTSSGTKTFNYLDGTLVSISGSGAYASKSFVYDGNGNLTNINLG
jgi:hypothetical protein